MAQQDVSAPDSDAATETSGRSRRWPWVLAAVLAVPLLAGVWWLVRPALVDDRVDTPFPVDIEAAPEQTATGGEQPDAGGEATTEVGDPMDGGAVVPDGQAPAAGASATEPEAQEGAAADDDEAAAADTDATATQEATQDEPSEPAGPTLVASGSFRGLDDHEAAGDAALFQQPDGAYVIRLTDLDADNGPGLELHAVPGRDQTRPADGSFVAPLQGNQGNQTYELPAGWSPPADLTVLIWCEPFSVPVGGATLDAR